MADLPFMPLYTDALLGDTTHLDATEFGAYCLILFTMWRSGGSLPDDDARLAKVARVNPAAWRKIGPIVREFLTPDGAGKLTQKRLAAELSTRLERRAVAAEIGSRGGRAKSLKTQQGGLANATPQLEQTPSEPPSKTVATLYQARNQIPELAVAADVEGSNSAREAALAGLRRRIGAVFERLGSLPPETGHAGTWLAAGYEPDLIVRTVEEIAARNGKVRSLRYFDDAIREAHQRQRNSPPDLSPGSKPWLRIPAANFALMMKIWRNRREDWPPDWGPTPDEPGCVVPAEMREAAGVAAPG